MLFSAELHCHTTYSDGNISPKEVLMTAKRKNISIIAITDHDEIKGALEAEKLREEGDPFVIPGIEISTEHGHLLAYFIREKILAESFNDIVDQIHAKGGIAIMAHPVRVPILYKFRGKKIKYPSAGTLKMVDGVEVYNAHNSKIANDESLKLAKEKDIKCMIAGSDAHFRWEIGGAKTIFNIEELNENNLKTAFRKGDLSLDKNLASNRFWYYIIGLQCKLRVKDRNEH